MTAPLRIVVGIEQVDAYLTEQRVKTSSLVEVALGQPMDESVVLLLAFTIGDKKHVAFTSLQKMEDACAAIRAASGVPRRP